MGRDVAAGTGLVLVATGVALVFVPAAFIAVGLLLIAVSIRTERTGKSADRRRP
jgi:hypothetical protein